MSTATTTTSTDQRFAAGQTTFEQITGLPAAAFLDGLKDLAPAFGRFVMEWEFADVYGRSSLNLRTREIIMVAVNAAGNPAGSPTWMQVSVSSAYPDPS
jgi:4-carboxymuconolactone decarboxylase